MSQSGEHTAAQTLAQFGANEWLVDEMYQQYLKDPGSVDKAWWDFFADYHPQQDRAGAPTEKPSTNGETAALDSSIAKYFATDRAYAVADRCLQVFGGMGLLREGPVERVLRHLRVLRVVEGASEVQKVVIARSLGLG